MKRFFTFIKYLGFTLIALGFLIFGSFSYLGYQSRAMSPELWLIDGKLAPCPDKPNCINTDNSISSQGLAPFHYRKDKSQTIHDKLVDTLESTGGFIISSTPEHLIATYQSTLFGFVDDFEVRIDSENHLLFFRSASRVGYGDMNANRNRVKMILGKLSASERSSL